MYDSYSNPSDMSGLAGLGATFWACYALFLLGALVLMVVIYWKLFSKAGYSGWLSLLMFVPLVNFGMMLFLAFSDWPVLKELRDLRARAGYGQGGYAPPPSGYAPPAPVYAPAQSPYAPQPPAYAPPAAPMPPAEQPQQPAPAEQPQQPAPPYPPQQ